MVLVDFSHLSMRNLFTSVYNARPKKIDGKYVTDDFFPMYLHQMLNSLTKIKRAFPDKEIVFAIDSRKNWRKEVYPLYKAHRKAGRDESEINFDEFFEKQAEFIEALKNFKVKIVEVEGAEADDIILVLAQKFGDKATIVTEDKDLKQALIFGSKMYMPIKDEFVSMSKEELDEWIKVHICIGDSSDNVPHIKKNIEFSKEFKEYLKEKGIQINELEFDNLSFEEQEEIAKDFTIMQNKSEKKIFKVQRFGEKTAQKFVKDLQKNLAGDDIQHILMRRNFARNKKLIHYSGIPEYIKQSILEEYEKADISVNHNEIMNFLMKNKLREHLANMTRFY